MNFDKTWHYCKRGYFRWGKISRKCWQDISRGSNFQDTNPFSFIKAYGFYFRVGVIFAKKTKAQKLPPRKNFHVYSIPYKCCYCLSRFTDGWIKGWPTYDVPASSSLFLLSSFLDKNFNLGYNSWIMRNMTVYFCNKTFHAVPCFLICWPWPWIF